jgi:Mg-chelatase subunit ChlD
MLDRDASGAVKLDAAVAAARTFLGLLALDASAPATGDQAAVLAFNADAAVLQTLTADRSALDVALGRIAPSQQTCLACAVEAADAELASPRHRPGTAAVVVLLTDGRANPRPASEAVAAAEAAKRRGVTFFTIALGDDVDADALAAIAAPGGRFERSADGAGLEGIYRQVAVDIPCPAGAFWGRR